MPASLETTSQIVPFEDTPDFKEPLSQKEGTVWLCTNSDKLKRLLSRHNAADSCWYLYSISVSFVASRVSFTSSFFPDKRYSRKPYVPRLLSEAIRALQHIYSARQGQTTVHPETLQAFNCISDGTLASRSQHGTLSHNIWVGAFQQI